MRYRHGGNVEFVGQYLAVFVVGDGEIDNGQAHGIHQEPKARIHGSYGDYAD